jgi:endogenous inhibitor of DNA gyrase (YacG/DUF329 family)
VIPAPAPIDLLPCPSCGAGMSRLPLDGHYGAAIDLDLCEHCHGIWFDRRESLRLTPGATVRLFEIIHDAPPAPATPSAPKRSCPRCQDPLVETSDRQRNTPFRYWRCGRGHGRYITFFDFLREKEFIRPLDAAQLEALRQHARSVNCSNCGAPIDLRTASRCTYCRTPLSMLDFAQVERTLERLRKSEEERVEKAAAASAHPALALSLLRERRQVERFFDEAEQRTDWSAFSASGGLVEAGLRAVVGMLRRLH